MEAGPLAQEPCRGVKVKLIDAVVHEDPAHRGPAQIMPAIKNAIFAAFLNAKPVLLEPILRIDVKVHQDYVGGVLRVITSKRGRVISIEQQGPIAMIRGEIPVSETFDLADQLRNATAGRAFWATEFSRWAPVPESLAKELIIQIRRRKGLKEEIPKPEDFVGL